MGELDSFAILQWTGNFFELMFGGLKLHVRERSWSIGPTTSLAVTAFKLSCKLIKPAQLLAARYGSGFT